VENRQNPYEKPPKQERNDLGVVGGQDTNRTSRKGFHKKDAE
jgi:hypothetical protein